MTRSPRTLLNANSFTPITNHMSPKGLGFAVAFMLALPVQVLAQDAGAGLAPTITVELNSTMQLDDACQLTFMLRNGLGSDVAALVFETVLFTNDGAVDRLTLFDMRDLPAGAPRVRQFNVPALMCDDLGRVLINGVADCSGPSDCGDVFEYSSRIDVEFLG